MSIEHITLPSIIDGLRQGKTVVYPTETCYGLGCDATNSGAVAAVFAIKQRQMSKTVLLLMADIDMAMQYVDWNPTIHTIAERYWPGPVTVVAKKRDTVSFPEGIVAADGTIAFRISSYETAVQLAEGLGKPLVSTSANIAAAGSPYDIATIEAQFAGKADQPDMIIDAGELPEQLPSTIIRVHESGDIHVLRQGAVVIDSLYQD